MNITDKKELAELFANALKHQPKKERDMPDLIFKAVSTLSMALIVWIFSTTNQLGQDVAIIKQNDIHSSEALKELQEFAKVPRFAQDNFEAAVTPIINNLNTNTLELRLNKSNISNIESRLIKIEFQVGELLEFKKN